jgi:hypothetical protein
MLKDEGVKSTQMLNKWVMRILTILLRVLLKRSFLGYMLIAANKAAYSSCHQLDSWVSKILVKPLSNRNLFFRNLWGVGLGFG